MPTPSEVILGLAAAVIAGLLANALCQVVHRRGFGLDEVSHRSNHSVPTPRTGGLAILVALASALAVLASAGMITRDAWIVLGLMAGAGGLGLADDFLTLGALPKLLILIALAAVTVVLLGPISTVPVPFFGWLPVNYAVGGVLTIFWLVGIVNVINFMDGLNGLIGSFAVLALTIGVSASSGVTGWPVLAAQVAVLGFLFCNAFKGKVFLGDAGSLALGFLIGAAPLAGPGDHGFWMMPLVTVPLIADVGLTLLRRAARGARLTEPHREHVYQRLKSAGWSHQAVALGVVFTAAAAMAVAIGLRTACREQAEIYWLSALMNLVIWAAVMAGMMALKPKSLSLEGTFR